MAGSYSVTARSIAEDLEVRTSSRRNMSASTVALVGVGCYTMIYFLLVRSVPCKAGIGFVSRLRVYYAMTDWSFWLEWNQAVFSIGTVVLYVVNSYYTESSYRFLAMKLEVFFAVFYSFNFLFELVLSKNRWVYVCSLLFIVDIATVVPVFSTLAVGNLKNSPTGFVRFYRVVMLSKIFRPFRLLRAAETLSPGRDAVMEQTAKSVAYFVSTLFLAAGMIQVLSEGRTEDWGDVSHTESSPMAFHDALYFIIVTFSTVGYGDISPPDIQSRLATILLVGFFFFTIPRELNILNGLLDLSSKYTGHYPKKLTGGHAIVGCDVATCGLVATFLEEFFHEDHGYNIMHLVLLVPQEPTMEWKNLVLKFAANDRVTYLKGDLRSTADLHRVSAQTASSCFILANRHGNRKEEDKRGFMRAISVQHLNPNIHIFVEALTVGMRQRLIKVGINPTRIVCVSTINTRILANACAWEGASTLINNLLVSTSIDEQRDMPLWVKEYACGLGKEIYVAPIGAFAGRGFSDLVQELFEQHEVILLGISEDRRVVLHPGAGYIITRSDLGFLIADDVDVAGSIIKQAGALPFLPSKGSSAVLAPEVEGNHQLAVVSTTTRAVTSRVASSKPRLSFSGDEVPEENGADKTSGDELRLKSPPSPALPLGGTPEPKTAAGRNIRVSRGYPRIAIAGFSAGAGGGRETEHFIVLVTSTLARVSNLVQALEAPQVSRMRFRVVCPLYEWNQERDMEEICRLRKFPQVSLLVGPPTETSLRAVGASSAKMVVVKAGKSFPEQETSDADAETIGQIVEVIAAAGPDIRAVVELNDMTYGTHFETLVDRLRSGPAPAVEKPVPGTPPTSARRRLLKLIIPSVCFSGGEMEGSGPSGRGRPKQSTPSNSEHANQAGRRQSRGDGDSNSISNSDRDREQTASPTPTGKASDYQGYTHWTLSRGVASGAIVPSSLPETLLCQAFYNPAIIMIVEALLDPKAQAAGPGGVLSDDGSDEPGLPDGERDGGAFERSGCGGREGAGGASFLAQIAPPKKFFRQAMLTGERPNFQALMGFMLSEYDALPFGLLRNGEDAGQSPGIERATSSKFVHCCPPPGQKVMPLDKVFLLAPNLDSWKKMQLDSPSTRPVHPGAGETLRSTSPSPKQRGFPPDQQQMQCDERGFPTLVPRARPRRRAPRDSTLPPSPEGAEGTPVVYRPLNPFISPFGRALPEERPASPRGCHDEGASWVLPGSRMWPAREAAAFAEVEGNTSKERDRRDRHDCATNLPPSPPSPTPRKGSHAKLDLLLHGMRRLNGRLDAIVGRLGVLEETRDIGEVML